MVLQKGMEGGAWDPSKKAEPMFRASLVVVRYFLNSDNVVMTGEYLPLHHQGDALHQSLPMTDLRKLLTMKWMF